MRREQVKSSKFSSILTHNKGNLSCQWRRVLVFPRKCRRERQDKMRYREQRNNGCRIHDEYTYKGMKVIVLENEKLRISVLADKGTDIFEFLYKPKDMDLMWLSANGVANPNEYLPTSPDPISTFIDYYPGGWQEIFPNGGPTSEYMGTQYGQHGEVAHMPWDYIIIEDTAERVQVKFTCRTKKAPFVLTKKLTLNRNSSSLVIDEEVENLSDLSLQVMWGQHLAYGKPFLTKAARIIVPDGVEVVPHAELSEDIGRVRANNGQPYSWPCCTDNEGNEIDLSVMPEEGTPGGVVYLTNFPEGRYEVLNEEAGLSLEVTWDHTVFPYVWYWQEFGGTKQYPWYGRHYNIGLEPFSSYPTSGLSEAIGNGTALELRGREKKQFTMQTSVKERS